MIKKIYSFFHNHYHRRYHGVYQHAKQLFVFDLFLLAFGIFVLLGGVYLAFWKPTDRHLLGLELSLGTDRVVSAQMVTVTVGYTNQSRFVLYDPIIALHWPNGFVVDRTATPTSSVDQNGIIHLDTLPPGAKGKISLRGRLFSTPLVEDRIVAIASFRPSDTNKLEQETLPYTFTLPSSFLRTTLITPTSTYPGAKISATVVVENTGSDAIDNIRLVVPESSLVFSDSDLSLFNLSPGQKKSLVGSIVLPTNTTTFSIATSPVVSVSGVDIRQGTATTLIRIFNPGTQATVSFAGGAPAFVEPGKTIPIAISWKNAGTVFVRNEEIRLDFLPGTVDLRASAASMGARVDGEGLVLSKAGHTELANGAPGVSGEIAGSIVLLPHFDLGDSENVLFTVTPSVTGELASVPGQTFSVAGTAVSAPVATEMSMTGAARYYTDDEEQLGRGPLPPRVGQTTRYWVLFDIFNTTNLASGASFVARLPAGVTFTGKQSVTLGSKLTYDADTGLVHWAYAQIPANSQTGLYFEVAATPTAGQVGQKLLLVEDARFLAKDDVVGKAFNLSVGALTNQLPDSDKGSRSGATVR